MQPDRAIPFFASPELPHQAVGSVGCCFGRVCVLEKERERPSSVHWRLMWPCNQTDHCRASLAMARPTAAASSPATATAAAARLALLSTEGSSSSSVLFSCQQHQHSITEIEFQWIDGRSLVQSVTRTYERCVCLLLCSIVEQQSRCRDADAWRAGRVKCLHPATGTMCSVASVRDVTLPRLSPDVPSLPDQRGNTVNTNKKWADRMVPDRPI